MRLLFGALIILLLLLQYRLWIGEGGIKDLERLRAKYDVQVAKTKNLRARNRALQAEVRDLKEGLNAIEERARAELGMIREGEIFIQVIEKQPDQSKSSSLPKEYNEATQ
ncbi:MAG: cell division protein FtsB [Gammaproteobacteria bacterium]|nr:MAG: cell division protein FtsB [Gammaproteobacteria bacterium]